MLEIAVTSAHRTQALAVRPADHLHGKRKQNLFLHHVLQIHALAGKEANF